MPKLVTPVKYGEDNSIDVAPTLTEEELYTLKQRMAAMDKLLATQKKAKYKIELFFSYRRTDRAPFPGALSLWESGAKLHGGGDTKCYECPGKELGLSDCRGIIPDASNGYGFLVCPECKKVWNGDQVIGERLARLNTADWARMTLNYFIRLGHNADIYVKAPKLDLRVASRLEQEKQLKGDKLRVARRKKDVYLYPLRHIIKDTGNGGDLLTRIHAFLRS
jgi:hypothetical protein